MIKRRDEIASRVCLFAAIFFAAVGWFAVVAILILFSLLLDPPIKPR